MCAVDDTTPGTGKGEMVGAARGHGGASLALRRGDAFVLPRTARRIAVGLRWAAALEDGEPVDLDVAGSCTLLDAHGSVLTTLSAQKPTDSVAGNAIRFVADPIFDFPPRLFSFFPFSIPTFFFHVKLAGQRD